MEFSLSKIQFIGNETSFNIRLSNRKSDCLIQLQFQHEITLPERDKFQYSCDVKTYRYACTCTYK